MTPHTFASPTSAFNDDRFPAAFPGHEAEMNETGHRACRELERVRREHGSDAVHAAAYALIVAAVGHYATTCGTPTAQATLQLLADNLGENVSPRPRLDS